MRLLPETEVHDNPGTIDHFRPAGAVQQTAGAVIERPGYFWLAYRWENLLLACIDCNQNSKRALFPLADPARRSRAFQDDLGREEPLLIDPSSEDPAQFLQFRGELVEAIDGNARGAETIRVLRLNDERRALVGHRRRRLQSLRALHALSQCAPNSLEAATGAQMIAQATSPDGEYRAMMVAATATAAF